MGLAVAGFGATIWVKLAGSWFGGLLNTTSVFGLPGVQSVFVIYRNVPWHPFLREPVLRLHPGMHRINRCTPHGLHQGTMHPLVSVP